MELTFSELRAKEVINTQDGKKLGKACDVSLCYPENKWLGIIVPGGRGWGGKKNNLFIDLRHIFKIGEDVILVNVGTSCKHGEKRNNSSSRPNDFDNRRNFEEYE